MSHDLDGSSPAATPPPSRGALNAILFGSLRVLRGLFGLAVAYQAIGVAGHVLALVGSGGQPGLFVLFMIKLAALAASVGVFELMRRGINAMHTRMVGGPRLNSYLHL